MIYKIFSFFVKPLVGSGIGRIKLFSNLYQKIMLKVIPKSEQVIIVKGFKIKVLTEGHINDIATELLFKGVHEPISTLVFQKLIHQGDCVVDVGANIGYYTLLSSTLVGNTGMVLAFEPDKNNMGLLRENIRLNQFDNIQTYEMALSNKSGSERLYISSTESARHSLIQTKEHSKSYKVAVERIDDVIDKATKVDFIKTDTEGNELAVLQGAEQTIFRNPDIKVLLEVAEVMLKEVGITVDKVWDYLINKLRFNYIYLVDDYTGRIKNVCNPKYVTINWTEYGSVINGGLVCNLLCSRKPINMEEKK